MTTHKQSRKGSLLATALLCAATLWPQQATKADAVGDVASVVDAVNAAESVPGSGPALGFTGNDLRDLDTTVSQCSSAGDSDDVLTCVEAVSSELPDDDDQDLEKLNKMIKVYFDIEHKDYWALIEDAGEPIACACAQILTDGVPVCGLLNDIANAAKDIYQGAQDVIQFLKDLGEDAVKFFDSIGCAIGLGGCDTGPPPPQATPDQLVTGYYAALESKGLQIREQPSNTGSQLPPPWQSFAGDGSGSQIVQDGIQNAHLDPGLLASKLPGYQAAVYGLWDNDVVSNYLPGAAKFDQTFAALVTILNYFELGTKNEKSIDLKNASLNYNTDLNPLLAPAQNACNNAYKNYGDRNAQIVEDWLLTPTPAKQSLQQLGQLPTDPKTVCGTFLAAVEARLTYSLRGSLLATMKGQNGAANMCTQTTSWPAAFSCGNAYGADRCNEITLFVDGKKECKAEITGPGKTAYVCTGGPYGPKPVTVFATINSLPAQYCKIGQVNNAPPGGAQNQ
jgi:hypothetical protein